MLTEILIIILVWLLFGLTYLLIYGSSNRIVETTLWEHIAILIICLPATIFMFIFYMIFVIYSYIVDRKK